MSHPANSAGEGPGVEKAGESDPPGFLGVKETTMPPKSEKQRRFMAADRERAREGKDTKTGMSEDQLSDYVHKPKGGYSKTKKK